MKAMPRRARDMLPAFLLAFALVVAQALGLAHRIAHPPAAAHGLAPAATAAAVQHTGRDAPNLFGEHDPGTAECRLLDQVAQGDALVAAVPAPLAPPVPGFDAPAPAAAPNTALARAYLARGPPRPDCGTVART